MTTSHRASPESRRSVWLFAVLGVVLLAAVAVLGLLFGGPLLSSAFSRVAEADETVTVGSDERAVAVVAPAGWVIVPTLLGTNTVALRSPDARLELTLQVPDAPSPLPEAASSAANDAIERLAEDGLVPEGMLAEANAGLFWIDEAPAADLTVRHASYAHETPSSTGAPTSVDPLAAPSAPTEAPAPSISADSGHSAPGVLVAAVAVAAAGSAAPSAAVVVTAKADDLERYRPAIAQILGSIGAAQ